MQTIIKTAHNGFISKLVVMLLLTGLIATLPQVQAAPLAGSVIGNQASATYTDGDGTEYATTSNLVETIVQPVYGLSLASDRSSFATAGGTVYFPHVLTNSGNTNDSFSLLVANDSGDDFDFSNLGIYLDADSDGNPDSASPITSIALAAGAQINLIVAATVPGLSSDTDAATATFTATSTNDGSQTNSVTDTATVRTGAVVQVLNSMSSTSGSADPDAGSATPYTVTLSYQNTGNAAASNLTITDTLPVGFHYVDDSGLASLTGSQSLTDDTSAEPTTSNGSVLTYSYDSGNHEINFTIDTIAAGESGFVRFQIHVLVNDNDGDPLGAGEIITTAEFDYDGQATEATNSVPFTVNPTIDVNLDSAGADTQTQASASQGSTLSFSHTIANLGNIEQIFNLVTSASSYPSGTSFKLFRADGVTPLVDTNGDGIVDAGVLAAGGSVGIVLKVTLPPGGEGGPSQVTLNAIATQDNTVSDSVIDVLTTISSLSVDLTVNASVGSGGDGSGVVAAGGEASPVDTTTALPGASITVPLFINNLTSSPDNYDIGIDNLPSGWLVQFYIDSDSDGVVDDGEPEVVNSGSIASSSNLPLLAFITISASALPGNQDLVFHGQSPNSSAEDYLKYRITVDSAYGLDFSLDSSGQAAAGASIVFTHRIQNTGNTSTGDLTLTTLQSNSNGWTASLHLDDGSTTGALDSSDSVYDPGSPPSLAANAEMTIFVKIIVPLSATIGAQNNVTITATMTTPGGDVADSVTDTVSVIGTEINLHKEQALDSNCDGVADTGFSNASIGSGAVPDACLIYRITANNSGSQDVSDVNIFDATPSYTSIESSTLSPSVTVNSVNYTGAGDCGASTPGVDSPADEATGTVTGLICDLPAGASGVLEFSVQIDP